MATIGFFGTPELSAQVLSDILADTTHSVAFVVTNPDKPVGRKQELVSSPVKSLAIARNIPVFQPQKIRNNTEFLEEISTYQCDYFIVVAYGKILPKELLEIPKKMCINIHGSLLPKYRGASPIQSALLAGETETGVTIMQMSEGMDEGDMILKEKIAISPTETSATLFQKFGEISGKTLLTALKKLENNEILLEKQNENEATYCGKINKEDGKIGWSKNAKDIFHAYQAYTPWPGIFAYFQGKRILFEEIQFSEKTLSGENPIIKDENGKYAISLSSGILYPITIKPEGKKSQKFSDFINGNRNILISGFDGQKI